MKKQPTEESPLTVESGTYKAQSTKKWYADDDYEEEDNCECEVKCCAGTICTGLASALGASFGFFATGTKEGAALGAGIGAGLGCCISTFAAFACRH